MQPLKSRSKPGPSDRWFWLSFVVFCSLVGIAVHPTSDQWGVAHICNQPLTLLGVTFLAARYLSLPPLCRGLLVTGLALDFLLGIALHFGLESRVFPYKLLDNQVQFSDPTQLVSLHGFSNYASRVSRGIVYWGDYLADVRLLLWIPLILGFIVVLGLLIQFDRRHAHLCQSSV